MPISKMKQTFFGGYFLNIGEARIKGGIVSEIKFEPDLLGDPLMSQEPCLDTIRPSERVFPGMVDIILIPEVAYFLGDFDTTNQNDWSATTSSTSWTATKQETQAKSGYNILY